MLRRRSLALLLLLPALPALTSACNARQGEDLADGFGCVDVVTVLEGPDAMSPLGFTAAEVLAVAQGSHQAPIFWHQGPIHFGPEDGQGALTVAVTYEGGEVRYVDSQAEGGDFEGSGCVDRLEIDAAVHVQTAGGALDEVFTGALQATRPDVAILDHRLATAALAGGFEVLGTDPEGGEVESLTLGVGISAHGLFGAVQSQVVIESGEAVAVGFHELATFPEATPTCAFPFEAPIPVDAAWGGHSAADALALLDAFPALELAWQGDAPTPLTIAVAPAGAFACGRLAADEFQDPLRFPVQVTLKSDDGRLDGALAVQASARVDAEGALEALAIASESPFADVVPVAEFAARFGVHGVDLSGYDGGAITFDLTCGADGHFGAITVLGATTAACSDEPGAPCEGTDFDEVTGGTWAAAGG